MMKQLTLALALLAATPALAWDRHDDSRRDTQREFPHHNWQRPPEGRYDRGGTYRTECREFYYYGYCQDE